MKAQRSIGYGVDGIMVLSVKDNAHILHSNAFVLFPSDNKEDLLTLKFYLQAIPYSQALTDWVAQLQTQWDDINRAVPVKEKK